VTRSGRTARSGSAAPHSPGVGIAQQRHPRAGTGTGYRYHSRPYYRGYYRGYHGRYYGSYYRPYFYGSLYFGWPFYDSYYWPGYYPPYPYYGSTYYGYPYAGYGYAPEDQAADSSLDRDRYGDRDRDTAAEEDRAPGSGRDDDRDFGQLRIEVRPDDASIYVNDRFQGTARQVRTLDLPPGRHRIEVVRPGYRTEEREVQITPGETSELSLELRRP
jgi:hypothetical protein